MSDFLDMFSKLKDGVSKVQRENRDNPNEATVSGSIFDTLRDKFEEVKNNKPSDRKGIFDLLRDKVNNVKDENEADPEQETAPRSLFDKLQDELEQLKKENERKELEEAKVKDNPWDINVDYEEEKPVHQETRDYVEPKVVQPTYIDPSPKGNMAILAVGDVAANHAPGSLEIRIAPQFGAGIFNVRLPVHGQVRILGFSDHTVNLDGKDSRWVNVDFQGNNGWVLESYLKK